MYRKYIKRCLDVAVSVLCLPIFAVICAVVGPAIVIEDRGPIFYNALRLGKDGVEYKMFKFRSMKVNAPDIRNEDEPTYNAEGDPRVTQVGKLLRKTSLDETPQNRTSALSLLFSAFRPLDNRVSTGFHRLSRFRRTGGRILKPLAKRVVSRSAANMQI